MAEAFDGSDGAKTRLAGYVAEQRVAADLVREGHAVEFPAGPTQAGWDLLVDGHAVQVKCSTSADYVLDHFGRYPDVPVIVNAELADQLGDHPMVWIDAALSHEEVTDATDDSVAALADLGDADFLPIPLVALAFAAVRNAGDLTAGNIDGGTYAQRVGVDVAARGLGGGAGGAVGAVVVGALIGPVGAALGSIVGGVIGSIAGGTGADAINRNAVCDARDLVVRGLGEFAVWFRTTLLRPRIAVLELRHNQVTLWAQEAAAAGKAPAAVATFYAASAEMLNRAKRLDSWIAGREDYDDFARAQAGWVALREAPGFFHPELKTHLAALRDALDRYRLAAHPEAAHRQDAQTDALARAAVDLTNMMSEMGNVIGRLGTPQGDDDRVLCIDVGRTCTRYVVLPRRAGRKDVGACVVKVARTSGFDRHVLNATCTKATEHRVRPRAIAVAVPFPVDYGKEGSLVATCHSEQRVCVYNDAVAWAAGAAAYRRMWGADVPLPALALVLGSGVGLAVVAEEESIIALEVSDVPWRLHELRRISPGNDAGCPSDCGPAVHSICGNDFFAWVARDKSHWSEDKVREEYTARVRALVDDILQPISRAVGPVRAILVGGRHSAFVSRQKLGQGTSLSVDVLSKRELPVNPDLVALLGLLNLAQSRQALRVLPSKEAMRLIAR
ncbi:MAG: hypothetical protein IT371_23570 [Deltaproteobacteria bacterium]|nr:hypothetical protein [Deltaproteobacteria bacterium]